MFLAFIAWYRGLAMASIACVGQMQLLQPFLTIFASGLLLDEVIEGNTLLYALGVVFCVALGKTKAVKKKTI